MGLFSGKTPANIGINNGKLAARPSSPNCVLSQGDKSNIAPFELLKGGAQDSLQKLKTLLENSKGFSLKEAQENYLYAESKTPLMGYIDDVEFYFCQQENLIHVRSASRLGYSDMGKNRSRVEAIRKEYQA